MGNIHLCPTFRHFPTVVIISSDHCCLLWKNCGILWHDGVMMAEDRGKSSASDEHYLGILPTIRSDEGMCMSTYTCLYALRLGKICTGSIWACVCVCMLKFGII